MNSNDYLVTKAKEVLARAERILYNPNWTLLEQNQLQAAVDLAKTILAKRDEDPKIELN